MNTQNVTMRDAFGPPLLTVVSTAAVAATALFLSTEEGIAPVALLLAGVVGYHLATVWWLLRLGAAPILPGAYRRRVAAILAVSAPATIWTTVGCAIIVIAGDNMWMLLGHALAPAVLVWPFAIAALKAIHARHHQGPG